MTTLLNPKIAHPAKASEPRPRLHPKRPSTTSSAKRATIHSVQTLSILFKLSNHFAEFHPSRRFLPRRLLLCCHPTLRPARLWLKAPMAKDPETS